MTNHTTGTREAWQAAIAKLHKREAELTRLQQELTRERRDLPWVRVAKEYTLDTDAGTTTLAELFEGRSQLLMYHIMFGPSWTAACPACSQLADHFDGMLAHLNARDVTLIGISRAPIEKLQAYKRRMGWQFPYVSSFRSDFNYDVGASFTAEQQREIAEQVLAEFSRDDAVAAMAASCGTDLAGYVTTEAPGLNAFALEDGVVYHTYAADPREVGFLVFYEQLLERAPKGGKEGVPVTRHDEYKVASAAATG
ncbi:MAG: hypothetical protein AUG48_11780 [Actinobacteria bacterium 13_1_20CM_3_68_9]|nr:MAG: hypothetical protein AUG48_11780 [Actinobacteria bacterium 13_1_20CM_3_68_9]